MRRWIPKEVEPLLHKSIYQLYTAKDD